MPDETLTGDSRAPLNFRTKVDSDTLAEIEELFNYQPWDVAQIASGQRIRTALQDAYATILAEAPRCPSRTRALNMLVDARMLANAAITHRGKH